MASSSANLGRILLTAASQAEVRAVLDGLSATSTETPAEWDSVRVGGQFEVLCTGVGKANACGAVALTIAKHRPVAVVCVGVAGVLPGSTEALALGTAIAADRIIMADEGVETPTGFLSLADLGFPVVPGGRELRVSAGVGLWLRASAGRQGPIATVSVCSGTDVRAKALVARTGAQAEAMEGAGVALAAFRAGVAFGELRIISNTTGDRDRQLWDFAGALHGLSGAIRVMADAAPARFSDLCE